MVPNRPEVPIAPLLATASGKLDKLVASRNRHGYFWRAHVVPVDPQTPAQLAARLHFKTVSQFWRDRLDPTERAAWDVYAASVTLVDRLGASISISGFNWWTRVNVPRLNDRLALIVRAPTVLSHAATGECLFDLIRFSPRLQFTLPIGDAWRSERGAIMYFYISQIFFDDVFSFQPPWSFLGSRPGVGPTVGTFGLGFLPLVGDLAFVKYRIQRADGRLSPWYFDRVLI